MVPFTLIVEGTNSDGLVLDGLAGSLPVKA